MIRDLADMVLCFKYEAFILKTEFHVARNISKLHQRYQRADTRAKGNRHHDQFGGFSHDRRGLINGILPVNPSRPAGHLNSYWFRSFK